MPRDAYYYWAVYSPSKKKPLCVTTEYLQACTLAKSLDYPGRPNHFIAQVDQEDLEAVLSKETYQPLRFVSY